MFEIIITILFIALLFSFVDFRKKEAKRDDIDKEKKGNEKLDKENPNEVISRSEFSNTIAELNNNYHVLINKLNELNEKMDEAHYKKETLIYQKQEQHNKSDMIRNPDEHNQIIYGMKKKGELVDELDRRRSQKLKNFGGNNKEKAVYQGNNRRDSRSK